MVDDIHHESMNETVKEHCAHPDCKYRGLFDGQPYCMYLMVEDRVRGCDISKCDKYASGERELMITLGGIIYCKRDGN